jgi:hypothetical protein
MSPRSISTVSVFSALMLAVAFAGCGSEVTGVPYRTMQRTVAGNYRAAELFDLPPQIKATSDGTDIRLSLGTYATFTGRIFVPGGAPGGSDIDVRISGDWHVEDQLAIIEFDAAVVGLPQTLVLRIFFLGDRVGLTGVADVHGASLVLDLSKPLPVPIDSEGGNSGNQPPSFSVRP